MKVIYLRTVTSPPAQAGIRGEIKWLDERIAKLLVKGGFVTADNIEQHSERIAKEIEAEKLAAEKKKEAEAKEAEAEKLAAEKPKESISTKKKGRKHADFESKSDTSSR